MNVLCNTGSEMRPPPPPPPPPLHSIPVSASIRHTWKWNNDRFSEQNMSTWNREWDQRKKQSNTGYVSVCSAAAAETCPGPRGPSAVWPRPHGAELAEMQQLTGEKVDLQPSGITGFVWALRELVIEALERHRECLLTDYSSWTSIYQKDTFWLDHG